MRFVKLTLPLIFSALLALMLIAVPSSSAGNVILSNNAGDASTDWFISGERSLVINGFDLTPLAIPLPTQLDRVSISVVTPVTNATADVVVYGDANGGSPVDATLLRRETVNITASGTFTHTFANPVTVNTPVVWVGFYLPVDFVFRADTQGTSVLTYWAWEPNSTFDLAALNTADVLGPANGSAPVNIDMDGVARITAELISSVTPATTATPATPGASATSTAPIRQIVGDPNTSLAPMVAYPDCSNVLYDRDDIAVTFNSGITNYCRIVTRGLRPEDPESYRRRGLLYDVYVFGLPTGIEPLPYPVTHCVRPRSEDLNTAVIGVATGSPREWRILPSVRFGDVVCAELKFVGFVSYFIPR